MSSGVKAAVVMAAVAGLTLTEQVLGAPPSAEAAVPSIRLTVCNHTFVHDTFLVDGIDENGVGRATYRFSLPGGGCHDVMNRRWAQGRTVTIFPDRHTSTSCRIPSGLADGSWYTCYVSVPG